MEPTLPTPMNLETSPVNSETPPQVGPFVEQGDSNLPEVSGNQMPVMPAPQAQVQTQPAPIVADSTTVTTPVTVPPTSDDPQIADDVDVIEKEWVDKAKKIVSATKDDPHNQEKEVSKLQATYLEKRYNKKIKLTE